MFYLCSPQKHGHWVASFGTPGWGWHRVNTLLLALEGLIKTELVISSNDDLVLVRLRGQPFVELPNFGQMSTSREVSGMDEDVTIWQLLSHVWRHRMSVAYAYNPNEYKLICLKYSQILLLRARSKRKTNLWL